MPRKARQQSSLCTYHVILRGVNQQIIFEDRYDYLQFIDMNDKNNTEVLESAMNKNKLVAKSAASNEVAADSLGRGCTQPLIDSGYKIM